MCAPVSLPKRGAGITGTFSPCHDAFLRRSDIKWTAAKSGRRLSRLKGIRRDPKIAFKCEPGMFMVFVVAEDFLSVAY